MGWLSRTKKSSVIQPLQNNIANSSKTTTGTLNAKNNFGETTQVIRQIRNCEPTNKFRSDQLNFSTNQYSLVSDSICSSIALINELDTISSKIEWKKMMIAKGPENANLAEQFTPQSEIDEDITSCVTYVADRYQYLLDKEVNQQANKDNALVIHANNNFNKTCYLFKNKEKITKLLASTEARVFSDKNKFDYSVAPSFYNNCLKLSGGLIPDGTDESSSKERRYLVKHMIESYAKKDISESQIPKIKKEFQKIKDKGKLDKDFIAIAENVIHAAELGLKNIKNPQRTAIFEKIIQSNTGVKSYESMSDDEIMAVVNQLKAIPMVLG